MDEPDFQGNPIRWPVDGQRWERYALQLLAAHYGPNEVQDVPADEGGDAGLDVLVPAQGIVYQCYAPREPLTSKDRYEKQRDKITADIKKLIEDPSGRVAAMLGEVELRRWVLFTPFFRRSDLIAHAQVKQREARDAGRPYVAGDFEIRIASDDMFPDARRRLAAAPPRQVAFDNPWGQAVWTHSAWSRTRGGLEDEAVLSARRVVARLASLSWHFATGAPAERVNPWRDVNPGGLREDDCPCRVLRVLGDLVGEHGANIAELLPEETSLLLAAPFLREAALAAGELRLLEVVDPFAAAGEVGGDGRTPHWLKHSLEAVYAKRPQLRRKTDRLKDSGDAASWQAVEWWLVHETVAALAEIWQPASEKGTGLFPAALAGALADFQALLPSREPKVQPLALARCLFSDPETFDDSEALPREVAFRGPHGTCRLRLHLVGRLLALAGPMACDPRRMSEVVVDHVGLSDPTSPAELVGQCRAAVWLTASGDWALDATCQHPAYDLALERLVDGLQIRRNRTCGAAEDNPTGIEPLQRLPTLRARLGATRLPDGRIAYDKPHVRFELAADEIKELLMGERLYGDPTLAIRELYQNALDACRYRAARLKAKAAREALAAAEKDPRVDARARYDELRERYLAEWRAPRPRDPEDPAPTDALIRFVQKEVDGRLVVECSDDGIGMGRRELEQCFACAGRRFTDTDAFVMERAEWRDLEARLGLDALDRDDEARIEFPPNSQFGIGVFSYFMLAEELEVVTRRFGVDGRPGPTVVARISGSGSLFRIRPAVDERSGSGTTVRLYLGAGTWPSQKRSQDTDLVGRLRELLWVAEFPTRAAVRGASSFAWKPDVLALPDDSAVAAPIVTGRLWWWLLPPGSQRDLPTSPVLADGIRTATLVEDGVCVNLRGWRRASLTANRLQVLDFGPRLFKAGRYVRRGPAHAWIEEAIERDGICALAHAELRYDWLCGLWLFRPALVQRIYDALTVSGGTVWFAGRQIPLRTFGLWPGDLWMLELAGELENPLNVAIEQDKYAHAGASSLGLAERLNVLVAHAIIDPTGAQMVAERYRFAWAPPVREAAELPDSASPFTPLLAYFLTQPAQGNGRGWGPSSPVNRATPLVDTAATFRLPIREVYDHLRRAEPLGLQLPPLEDVLAAAGEN